jgi:hypothetical protein
MFFLFSEIIFHSQIIIEKSTYFKGGGSREMKEKLKKRKKEMKMKKKEEVYVVFEIIKKKY